MKLYRYVLFLNSYFLGFTQFAQSLYSVLNKPRVVYLQQRLTMAETTNMMIVVISKIINGDK
jgi:hypothetical protein